MTIELTVNGRRRASVRMTCGGKGQKPLPCQTIAQLLKANKVEFNMVYDVLYLNELEVKVLDRSLQGVDSVDVVRNAKTTVKGVRGAESYSAVQQKLKKVRKKNSEAQRPSAARTLAVVAGRRKK